MPGSSVSVQVESFGRFQWCSGRRRRKQRLSNLADTFLGSISPAEFEGGVSRCDAAANAAVAVVTATVAAAAVAASAAAVKVC